MSGTAALKSGVTSFRPRLSIVGVHSPQDFCTGHMGMLKGEQILLKGEQILLITPWLSKDRLVHGWGLQSLGWCNTAAGAQSW